MTLWANELLAIRRQVIEVHLISLRARLEVANANAQLDAIWEIEALLIKPQIEALEKELEIVIPIT